MKDDAKKVLWGSPSARIVTSFLLFVVLVGLFFIVDQASPKFDNREGMIAHSWYQGGTVSFGMVPTPKPNEQGAQTPAVSASNGVWYFEIVTPSDQTEVVQCAVKRPGWEPGRNVFYRQKLGRITGMEFGLPTCA